MGAPCVYVERAHRTKRRKLFQIYVYRRIKWALELYSNACLSIIIYFSDRLSYKYRKRCPYRYVEIFLSYIWNIFQRRNCVHRLCLVIPQRLRLQGKPIYKVYNPHIRFRSRVTRFAVANRLKSWQGALCFRIRWIKINRFFPQIPSRIEPPRFCVETRLDRDYPCQGFGLRRSGKRKNQPFQVLGLCERRFDQAGRLPCGNAENTQTTVRL